jgi:hypothetical protein
MAYADQPGLLEWVLAVPSPETTSHFKAWAIQLGGHVSDTEPPPSGHGLHTPSWLHTSDALRILAQVGLSACPDHLSTQAPGHQGRRTLNPPGPGWLGCAHVWHLVTHQHSCVWVVWPGALFRWCSHPMVLIVGRFGSTTAPVLSRGTGEGGK